MSHHISTLRTVRELRAALDARRRAGGSIGLVPTMGALHEGHLSLIRAARERCETVVVSIFVNPSQFDRAGDLARYPRQEERDLQLAAQASADIVFVPAVEEVYPAGFATQVQVLGGLAERLEGEHRGAGHFRGVATVVVKLLNMVGPDVAFFGQKDAQQALVIRRLVADLNLPVAIEVVPTVRDADGLALSSRNAQLSPAQREQAPALVSGLRAAAALFSEGERSATTLLAAAREAMGSFAVQPEYLALVDPETLEDLERIEGPALLALAAYLGSVRLIDNLVLDPVNPASSSHLAALSAGPAGRPIPYSTRKVPACSA